MADGYDRLPRLPNPEQGTTPRFTDFNPKRDVNIKMNLESIANTMQRMPPSLIGDPRMSKVQSFVDIARKYGNHPVGEAASMKAKQLLDDMVPQQQAGGLQGFISGLMSMFGGK